MEATAPTPISRLPRSRRARCLAAGFSRAFQAQEVAAAARPEEAPEDRPAAEQAA